MRNVFEDSTLRYQIKNNKICFIKFLKIPGEEYKNTMKKSWREAATLIVVARAVTKNLKFDYKVRSGRNQPLIVINLIGI